VGFPVAKPVVLCEDESVIGTAFYVMDYVDGRVLWDQSLPGMSKAERFAIWDEMNRVIARLHTIDFEKIGLADFGRPGAYIARQVARWTKQYQASETEKIEAMDNLIAWLPANIPAQVEGTGLDVHAVLEPARQVGGDLFEVLRLGGGDLYAVVKIVVPKKLSKREKQLFEELRDASSFDPRKDS